MEKMKKFTHCSAVTDRQWVVIAPLLSGKETDCGVTAQDIRLFCNAAL